jgi:hypothetical protein
VCSLCLERPKEPHFVYERRQQAKLTSFARPKKAELRCKLAEILRGLYLAQKQRKKLVVDENADNLATEFIEPTEGLVLVENVKDPITPPQGRKLSA